MAVIIIEPVNAQALGIARQAGGQPSAGCFAPQGDGARLDRNLGIEHAKTRHQGREIGQIINEQPLRPDLGLKPCALVTLGGAEPHKTRQDRLIQLQGFDARRLHIGRQGHLALKLHTPQGPQGLRPLLGIALQPLGEARGILDAHLHRARKARIIHPPQSPRCRHLSAPRQPDTEAMQPPALRTDYPRHDKITQGFPAQCQALGFQSETCLDAR